MSRVELNSKAIADGQIKAIDIASGAVTSAKLADGSVIASKIDSPLASLAVGNFEATSSTITNLTAGGITFPTSDGANGHFLTTNGSGTMSFASLSSLGRTLSVIGRSSTVAVDILIGHVVVATRSGTVNVGVT